MIVLTEQLDKAHMSLRFSCSRIFPRHLTDEIFLPGVCANFDIMFILFISIQVLDGGLPNSCTTDRRSHEGKQKGRK
jgi:hypothetical protein